MRPAAALALALACAACAGPSNPAPATPPSGPPAASSALTEVVVIGTVHGRHKKSERYSLAVLRDLLLRLDPDVVMIEVPPDRWPGAREEHRKSGQVTEPRVKVFPEYVDVLLPLLSRGELRAEVVPTAGWTKAMNDARKLKLAEYPRTRAAQWAESEAAEKRAEATLKAENLDDDPAGIHTDRYDAVVKEGLGPYSRHFNDDLGAGGWENINAAHWALIAAGLDRIRGQGKRVVITFGAWHKYWFREQLRRRGDVVELPLATALAQGRGRGRKASGQVPSVSVKP